MTDGQTGSHEIASDMDEYDEYVPIELVREPTLNQLEGGLYNKKEGFREPLTNAISAVLRASKSGYIKQDEMVVEVDFKKKNGRNTLIIRDNGIGLTEKEVKDVLTKTGKSSSRDDAKIAGKFGIGFLAIFLLVGGRNGAFVIKSFSRKSNKKINGLFNSGGVGLDHNGSKTGGLREGYGTTLELFLDEDISSDDIEDWIEEFGEWSRVPIVFTYEDEVEEEKYKEEYGGKKLEDKYETESYTKFENKWVTAVQGDNSEGDVILLDTPIENPHKPKYLGPAISGNIDVRLKTENSVVVHGPNKGEFVVDDSEYEIMNKERQEKYIPESNLHADDVYTPSPTTTRKSLEENDDFWEWVVEQIKQKHKKRIKDILNTDVFTDILDVPFSEFEFINRTVRKQRETEFDDFQDSLKNTYNFSTVDWLDEEVFQKINYFSKKSIREKVQIKDEGVAQVGSSKNLSDYIYERNPHTDVFVYYRLSSPEKAEALLQERDDVEVVKISKYSDSYELVKDFENWHRLKDVTVDTAEKYEISPENLRTKKDKAIRNKKITVHSTKHITSKLSVNEICNHLEGKSFHEEIQIENQIGTEINFKWLIAFPNHHNKNVSDNYDNSDRGTILTAGCTKKQWNLIKDLDKVMTLDSYKWRACSVELYSSEFGDFASMYEILEESENVILHEVQEEFKHYFEDPQVSKDALEYFKQKFSIEGNYDYCPVTDDELDLLKPLKSRFEIVSKELPYSKDRKHSLYSNTSVLAYSWLDNISETARESILNSKLETLEENGLQLLQELKDT